MGGVGVYVPPAKRKRLEAAAAAAISEPGEASDVSSSVEKQRQSWQEGKRVVHGTVNRLNSGTIKPLIHDLFCKVNLLRFRGVLVKSILSAAISSTRYSNVYAALVAVLNTKLPEVGELVVQRAILLFRRFYRRREKANCIGVVLFISHLFHQAVVHELLVLQILTLLLDGDPTDDSVEVAVQFLAATGPTLLEVSPAGVRAVLERLRSLLHEGGLNQRVEYNMEQLLKKRKTGFRYEDIPPIPEELDLVERDDQITHELSLDDEDITKQDHLDVFSVDTEFDDHEEEWKKIQSEILGLGSDSDSVGESETDDGDSSDSEDDQGEPDTEQADGMPADKKNQLTVTVADLSEADLVHLRRTIYLTIMSSASFEECTHKLTKVNIPPGKESELINMLIECCSQERTFLRYYGLISARFCLIEDRWADAFLAGFEEQYNTIHRLETNKLRNVAKLFAHLLHTDSLPWSCLSIVHLNEDETTSSSRIFVKILVQEIAEQLGIAALKSRFETDDPVMAEWFKGMFPKDNVRNTRYAINFFTSIGLGPLTDDLRTFLKNAPKLIMARANAAKENEGDDDSSSTSSSSSDSSSTLSSSSSEDSSSSDSSSSSSSYGRRRGRRRRRRRRSRSYSSSRSSSSSDESSPGRRRKREKDRKRRSRSLSESQGRSPETLSEDNRDRTRRRSRTVSRSPTPEVSGTGDKRNSERSGKKTKRRSPSVSRSPTPEGSYDKSVGGNRKRRRSPSVSRSPTPGENNDKGRSGEKRNRRRSPSYSSDDSSRRNDGRGRRNRRRSYSSSRS